MRVDLSELTKDEELFQMAPMIDVVFLLLIYFMVSATLLKQEADLSIQLPGRVKQAQMLKMPDEQIIEIRADGKVILNSQTYDTPDSRDMPQLTTTLIKFKSMADDAQSKAMITIQSADNAKHQKIIDVLNACSSAQIVHVTFGLGSD